MYSTQLLFHYFISILLLRLAQWRKVAMNHFRGLLTLAWNKLKHGAVRVMLLRDVWLEVLQVRERGQHSKLCAQFSGRLFVSLVFVYVDCIYHSCSALCWGSIAWKFVKQFRSLSRAQCKRTALCWSVALSQCTCCKKIRVQIQENMNKYHFAFCCHLNI